MTDGNRLEGLWQNYQLNGENIFVGQDRSMEFRHYGKNVAVARKSILEED